MPIWLQQLITVLLWAWVGYQLVSGRSMSWGKEEGAIFNGKWIYRDEEPAKYWGFFGFTAALVVVMTYMAFIRA